MITPVTTTLLSQEQVLAKLETATRIYLGKAFDCCCGCSGTYAERGTPAFNARRTRAIKLASQRFVQTSDGPTYCCALLEGLSGDKWLIIYQD